jgi:hypothetical protein
MELQAAYWRKQLGELAAQAGEMRTLSAKVTADVVKSASCPRLSRSVLHSLRPTP